VKKGRTNKTVGDVFSGIGGFGMGLSLALIVSTPKEKITTSVMVTELSLKNR
jgi:hypothetical protein